MFSDRFKELANKQNITKSTTEKGALLQFASPVGCFFFGKVSNSCIQKGMDVF
jgi:hypothetical protein